MPPFEGVAVKVTEVAEHIVVPGLAATDIPGVTTGVTLKVMLLLVAAGGAARLVRLHEPKGSESRKRAERHRGLVVERPTRFARVRIGEEERISSQATPLSASVALGQFEWRFRSLGEHALRFEPSNVPGVAAACPLDRVIEARQNAARTPGMTIMSSVPSNEALF